MGPIEEQAVGLAALRSITFVRRRDGSWRGFAKFDGILRRYKFCITPRGKYLKVAFHIDYPGGAHADGTCGDVDEAKQIIADSVIGSAGLYLALKSQRGLFGLVKEAFRP